MKQNMNIIISTKKQNSYLSQYNLLTISWLWLISVHTNIASWFTGVKISKSHGYQGSFGPLMLYFWGPSQSFTGPDFLLFFFADGTITVGLKLSPQNLRALRVHQVLILRATCNFAGHWPEGPHYYYYIPWWCKLFVAQLLCGTNMPEVNCFFLITLKVREHCQAPLYLLSTYLMYAMPALL